jgi:hypothetical protein
MAIKATVIHDARSQTFVSFHPSTAEAQEELHALNETLNHPQADLGYGPIPALSLGTFDVQQRVQVYPCKGEAYTTEVESFTDLRRLLNNGYIDIVPADDEDDGIYAVDEEGLIRGLPRNPHLPEYVGTVVKLRKRLLHVLPYGDAV